MEIGTDYLSAAAPEPRGHRREALANAGREQTMQGSGGSDRDTSATTSQFLLATSTSWSCLPPRLSSRAYDIPRGSLPIQQYSV